MTWLAGQIVTAQRLLDNTPHTVSYTATTSTVTGTSEMVYLTSSSFTLRNGRAYRITVSTLITGNSADTARIFVKRTNVSGNVLFDTQRVAIPSSGSNGRVTFENVASNSTGSDITDVLVATIQRASGTAASVGTIASSTSPSYLQVEDIGANTDFPTATAIT